VAQERLVLPVVRERHLAIPALHRGSALEAREGGGEPAPVEEEHRLLAARKGRVDRGLELGGEVAVGAAAVRAPLEIDHGDFRHPAPADPLGEGKERRGAGPHPVERLGGRGGGAQQDDGVFHAATQNGEVPRLVPDAVLLLVRGVVLLIHNDEPHGLEG
jgi:hypothetical protein